MHCIGMKLVQLGIVFAILIGNSIVALIISSPSSSLSSSSASLLSLSSSSNNNVGYEYLPPNPDALPGIFHNPALQSSYPISTPAGLRGEAVRSALIMTERCLGWKNNDGMLQIRGGGTVNFLNGKLTASINDGDNDHNNEHGSNTNNNRYKEGCLLDAKGRLIDVLRISLFENGHRALMLTSPGHTSMDLMQRLDPFVFPLDEVTLTNFVGDDGHHHDTASSHHQSSSSSVAAVTSSSFAFTLASTQHRHVQRIMQEQSKLVENLDEDGMGMVWPGSKQSVIWKVRRRKTNSDDDEDDGGGPKILVVPSTALPAESCVGYTFVFFGGRTLSMNNDTDADADADKNNITAASLGRQVWNRLIDEENVNGPVEVGALEYETLRIEAGQPQFGFEYGINRVKEQTEVDDGRVENGTTMNESNNNNNKTKNSTKRKTKSMIIKTSPMELHYKSLIDENKGCYLGQEGIASVLKNKRGPPRKLYSVVFLDDVNIYETQSMGDKSDFENQTKLPQPGQKLYALGSNEQLHVGTLTSVGEAGGTGNANIVALALVKRSDSIQKKMNQLGLTITRDPDDYFDDTGDSGSGMIQPPPLDPLDDLEVIVEGSFTVGVLKCVPSRGPLMGKNCNMFADNEDNIQVETIPEYEEKLLTVINNNNNNDNDTQQIINTDNVEGNLNDTNTDDGDLFSSSEEIEAELKLAAAEAEAAAAEAERKAEKMELLKKRAKEAMERRKQKREV